MFERRARIPVDLLCGTGETGDCVSVNSNLSELNKVRFCRKLTIRFRLEWDYV